ncbi:MAG: S8 family peptidase [Bacteroidales bacterium]
MRCLFIVLLLFVFIPFNQIFAQDADKFRLPAGCSSNDYIPGHVIVKFSSDVSDRAGNRDFLALMQELNVVRFYQKFPHSKMPSEKVNEWGMPMVDISGIYELCFDSLTSVEFLINRLLSAGLFEYACPHYIEHQQYVPDDPNIGSQYYLTNIRAYQAWDICKSDTNRIVAITDTGYEFNHPDLSAAVKHNFDDPIDGVDNDNDGYTDNFSGWDMGSWDNNPQYAASGHGIHVSGLAGASADNGFGMAGVGFKSRLLPVKVDNANGNLVATYEGVVYAADHGATVINCSWGSTYSGNLYGQDIVNYASYNCNALVVAACGNANNMNMYYPASYNNVLSVAGTDANDYKSSNSSFGYKVDICAPGIGIYSTWSGASFVTSGGTSMASPIVAGAAALVSSWYPQYNMLQIGEILRNSADIIDTISANQSYDGLLGMGRLNMHRALTDSITPAVRLVEWAFSDSSDMEFDPGDTLFIRAKALNFLDTSSALLYAKLECLTPEVDLIDSIWMIGTLNTLQYANNYSAPFKVKLSNVPPSTNIAFLVHFYDSTWHSADYISTNVNKDYNTLDTNQLTLTVTSHGNFAYNNLVNLSQGEGFRFNDGSNLVSGFGFMCGTDMFHLADNLYSIVFPVDSDFVADNFVLDLNPAPMGDQCLFSQYTDQGADSASQMNIVVRQWSYAWNTPEDRNYILVRYQVVNDSIVGLDDFYTGLFADWDIINSAENRCWYDPAIDAIIATTTDSVMFTATALLSPYSSKHYAVDMDGFNSSIALTDGFSESEKYSMMKTNRLYAGTDLAGNDIAAMVSSGPHTIAPFDTLELAYVIVAGTNFTDIADALARARIRYLDPDLGNASDDALPFLIYPNPALDRLHYFIPADNDRYDVYISDMTGKLCIEKHDVEKEGQFDVSILPAGLYTVSFVSGKTCSVMNFTIVR